MANILVRVYIALKFCCRTLIYHSVVNFHISDSIKNSREHKIYLSARIEGSTSNCRYNQPCIIEILDSLHQKFEFQNGVLAIAKLIKDTY